MKTSKVFAAVVGSVVALVAVALIVGAAGLMWAYGTERDDAGFFVTPEVALSTDSYALVSADIDLGARPGDWVPAGRLAEVLVEVESSAESDVFVGVGPEAEVRSYLDSVARDEVVEIGPSPGDVTYRRFDGEAPTTPPGELSFWVAAAAGPGLQSLTWEVEPGEWTAVIMNTDASAGVAVDAAAGAHTDLLIPVAVGLLIAGLFFGVVAAALLVIAVRSDRAAAVAPPAPSAPGPYGPYPVRLEGHLDPDLSRWQWLVKWLLALPHFVALAFLWAAFVVLTVVAFFAIIFTGRYPRSIFDFNVGVLRWTWRVGYYSYSALGTDQYPPFTLDDVDYPARFDVAYPEQLSRGLALVKWWLLAIPHYLIVGLFTSGLVWWTTDIGISGDAALEIGGGLIGLLVLIAGLALVFTARYPGGLFDLIIGLNRWVFRVVAYAALMRDEYPPFRLDTGGSEPTSPEKPGSPGAGGSTSRSRSMTGAER
jgi:hypothetical protein